MSVIDLCEVSLSDLNAQAIPAEVKDGRITVGVKAVVSIAPPQTVTVVDEEVTVDVRVDEVADLYGFQFDVKYDSNVLEVVKVEEGDFLKQGGNTYWVAPNIQDGLIDNAACTLQGAPSGVSGSGVLARITFKAKAKGMSVIDLCEVSLSDLNAQAIPAEVKDGRITVGVKYGTVYGIITDAVTNQPIQKAVVTIGNKSDSTDSKGYYRIEKLRVGPYALRIRAKGYYEFSIKTFMVKPGEQEFNCALRPIQPVRDYPGAFLESPNWKIKLSSAGYSDQLIYNWQIEGGAHNMLCGEWAAAIKYDGIQNTGADPTNPTGAQWLTQKFIHSDWSTGSPFNVVTPITVHDTNGDGFADTGKSVVSDGKIRVEIEYKMIDTITGTPMGMKPDPDTGTWPVISDPWVLLQTYKITNISKEQVTDLKFFQILHSHPVGYGTITCLYDSTFYAGYPFSAYHYDITQWRMFCMLPEVVGFSSPQSPPDFYGVGHYRGHGDGKPVTGLHWDVESGALAMNTLFAESGKDKDKEGIAGGEGWVVGTLAPGDSVSIPILLSIYNPHPGNVKIKSCIHDFGRIDGMLVKEEDITPLSLTPNLPTPHAPGTEFVIEAKVGSKAQPVSDLTGISFKVKYDKPAMIEAVKIEAGDFLGEEALNVLRIDTENNMVHIGLSRKSVQGGVDGYGVVAKIRFRLKNAPIGERIRLTVEDIHATDSKGKSIKLGGKDTEIVVGVAVSVWPGDMNNDGVVDKKDIIPIALHWKQTGPARENASLAWKAQPALAWDVEGAVYADGGGDGRVDATDILAVGANWGKTHVVRYAPAVDSTTVNHGQYIDAYREMYELLENSPDTEINRQLKAILQEYIKQAIAQSIPAQSMLMQNYPNPFNPECWIPYALSERCHVMIKIYSITGQLIRTLDLGVQEPGTYISQDKAAYWDGLNDEGEEVASGVYFYRLQAGDKVSTKKMVVLK
jgi:hypothetical protein